MAMPGAHNVWYNLKNYVRVMPDEFIGICVTAVFASFILTFNDWGTTTFNVAAGLRSLLTVFIYLAIIFLITTCIAKLIGIKQGFLVYYQPHLIGMMAGLIICVASAGYLPIFLPGGFKLDYPHRMVMGKWRGYHRQWELGMINGLFPLVILAFLLLLNPLYMTTGNEMYVKLIVVTCLVAIFAMIPLPNIALEYGGRVTDFFRYLKGATFGFDVFFCSKNWYTALVTYVLFFSIVSYILTKSGAKVGVALYILSWIVGGLALFIYRHIVYDPSSGQEYHFTYSGGEPE
ncbi:MAG: hypothetical protein OXR66_03785 [Candidatus Woesearchaeota archaeon]|nr:hypothetical protein [Candidatus Woesearchaeota archaeon]